MSITPKYTPEQRAEAIRLINEGDVGPNEAVRRLAAGSNGLEPFQMPSETARRYAHDARVKNAPDLQPGNEIQTLTKRLLNVVHQELKVLEDRTKQGNRDLNRVEKMTDILLNLDKLKKGNPAPKARKPNDGLTSLAQTTTSRSNGTPSSDTEPNTKPERTDSSNQVPSLVDAPELADLASHLPPS